MNKTKKRIYILLGSITLAIGVVGVILPLLPYFPFLLLTAFFYGKSSEKLDRWFKNSKVYKNNLAAFVATRKMTKKVKIKVMIMITILIGIGFVTMYFVNVPTWAFIVLFFVWLFHLLLFRFKIKTLTIEEEQKILSELEA